MRAIVEYIRNLFRRVSRKDDRGLTEVEYEAITLIAQEGRVALSKAREQAAYCRRRGSEEGYEFWMRVADEISLRTSGRPAQPPRAAAERKGH
jgi:hypothetical protein